MPEGKTTHEFGFKPVDRARKVLDSYEIDGTVEEIKIEISESEPDEPQPKQTQTPGNEDDEEEDDRELGDIQRGTSHHKVLWTMQQLQDENDGLVSGNEIKDVVSGVEETTIFPALTQLYQRKMVEREKVSEDGNWHNEYEVSKYGEAKLNEMGEPDSW